VNSIPVCIRCPELLRRVLRKQARVEHRSVSSIIVHLLDTHAKVNGWYERHASRQLKALERKQSNDEG
jgi:hypothetical protein